MRVQKELTPSIYGSISRVTVSELMSKDMAKKPRPGQPTTASSPRPKSTFTALGKVFPGRDGLLAYIQEPETFPSSRVIYHNEEWVLIRDLYPKASVHLLLLPRNPRYYSQHPFNAFEDAKFLASAKTELVKAKETAVSELRRIYGRFSESEKERIQAMEADDAPPELPIGRDWSKDILTGIHANPSMNHLHIHILSCDRQSECLRHRKHYNSFNTRFLVPLDDFPVPKNDMRWHAGGYMHEDMVCWRCGKNFGNKFAKLKVHLEEEFEAWKKI